MICPQGGCPTGCWTIASCGQLAANERNKINCCERTRPFFREFFTQVARELLNYRSAPLLRLLTSQDGFPNLPVHAHQFGVHYPLGTPPRAATVALSSASNSPYPTGRETSLELFDTSSKKPRHPKPTPADMPLRRPPGNAETRRVRSATQARMW